MLKVIKMFTDGSCLGNPGAGGYGTILRYKSNEKILTSGFFFTTNNRMELMAVILGLESLLESCFVKIITDSLYVKTGVINWLPKWKKNNWKNSRKKDIKNIDLWLRINFALKKHVVHWIWVKAHRNHVENEKCDFLARESAKNPVLKDVYYEKTNDIYNKNIFKETS